MEVTLAISRIWLCTRNRTVIVNNQHERTCEAAVRDVFPCGASYPGTFEHTETLNEMCSASHSSFSVFRGCSVSRL
jgi:hypothetical protein